ncbi:hypothetical protein IW261DRAFT_1419594 [Armillaria novae-zelandiae]|uniref:Uncharacterized protein n=1 Tax=Armillaria novae-zelandiae TaxID=153914 RepID=A0AA39P8D6_9AGAR|nr:hypothetical protein IW261DRAFT_1419594 [Armillaria novae-zelandiae]
MLLAKGYIIQGNVSIGYVSYTFKVPSPPLTALHYVPDLPDATPLEVGRVGEQDKDRYPGLGSAERNTSSAFEVALRSPKSLYSWILFCPYLETIWSYSMIFVLLWGDYVSLSGKAKNKKMTFLHDGVQDQDSHRLILILLLGNARVQNLYSHVLKLAPIELVAFQKLKDTGLVLENAPLYSGGDPRYLHGHYFSGFSFGSINHVPLLLSLSKEINGRMEC